MLQERQILIDKYCKSEGLEKGGYGMLIRAKNQGIEELFATYHDHLDGVKKQLSTLPL